MKATDLYYAVATFNADPYCVESDEQVEEIMSEINNNGMEMITDEDERKVALERLDLPEDSERIVYRAGSCIFSMDDDEYTYDVQFNNDENSNSKGFRSSKEDCIDYIKMYNGTDESYFEDYKGGTVSVICHETEETVYEEDIPHDKTMRAYNYLDVDEDSTSLVIEDGDTVYEFFEPDRNMLESCEYWTPGDCKNYMKYNEPTDVRTK